MKYPTALLTVLTALATIHAANAAVVTVAENINNFLTSPNTSPHTKNVVFDDGLGNTVTLQVTVSSTGAFNSLDYGIRVGVVGGGDSNHISSNEPVTFSVAYLSSTGSVDLSSIAFRFDSIGFRNLNLPPAPTSLYWQLNGGPSNVFATTPSASSEDFYTVETGFTTIGTGANNYVGVFKTDSAVGQFTTQDKVGANITGQGLQFSVQFAPIPEPSAMLLGGLGMLALLHRRRRP